MHAMNLLLPWLASWICHLPVSMLVFSCKALWWGVWARKVAFMMLFMPCSVFLPSLKPVNETCYVYMGAIICSVRFGLMVSKGLLFYAFSRFMPCLVLLWYVPVACCLLTLNMASWCYSWHVSIFIKSVKLIFFALLPCLFEPALVWFSRSSVFIFCQASWVDHCHVLCCYVRVQ